MTTLQLRLPAQPLVTDRPVPDATAIMAMASGGLRITRYVTATSPDFSNNMSASGLRWFILVVAMLLDPAAVLLLLAATTR